MYNIKDKGNKLKKHKEFYNSNLIYFLIVVLFVGVRICTAMDVFSFLGEAESYVLTVFVQVGVMFLLPWFLSTKINKKKPTQTLRDFGFWKIDFKTILISILIGILVFVLNIFISLFFSYILALFGYSAGASASSEQTWQTLLTSLVTVAILPAFCEEFTHRGMLLSAYKKLGLKKAVLLSALMFALIHLNVGQFFYAFVAGIVLAIVALYSRSIVPSMIIHFINNGINVYLDFAKVNGTFGGNFYELISKYLLSGSLFSSVIFIALFVTLVILLLVFLISLLLKINAQKSILEYAKFQALLAMREEVLSDVAHDKPNVDFNQPPIVFARNATRGSLAVKIPYEVLGFYIEPAIKPTAFDKTFFYATLILGALVTISTFIWGIL